ncbi:MAG: hypothetical protein RLZZ519_2519 [Bacteroidota bacterium]
MTATLLIPAKSDQERDRVAQAWEAAGGIVLRVEKFWVKPDLAENEAVAIYGNDTFAQVLAQVLSLHLHSPDDALIGRISKEWTKRNVMLRNLVDLVESDFPLFVKPVIPKQFAAAVYQSLSTLQAATLDLPGKEAVLTSEKVEISAESRFFVLDGEVQASALYEGEGDLAEAELLVSAFALAHASDLPRTYVVDLAFNPELGWFLLEFNSAWGAGLNGCDPQKVLQCIAAATTRT